MLNVFDGHVCRVVVRRFRGLGHRAQKVATVACPESWEDGTMSILRIACGAVMCLVVAADGAGQQLELRPETVTVVTLSVLVLVGCAHYSASGPR